MSHAKGETAEHLMRSAFTRSFLESSGGWAVLTPNSIGRTGLDGLFVKFGSQGELTDLLVAESKYGSSKLGMTRDGRQMGAKWIEKRLRDTAKLYKGLADGLDKEGVTVSQRSRFCSVKKWKVPTRNGLITISRNKSGTFDCRSSDPTASKQDMQRTLRQVAAGLDAFAEDGQYRSRLFSFRSEGKDFVITVSKLDSDGNVTGGIRRVKGPYHALDRSCQDEIKKAIKKEFRKSAYSDKEAEAMAKKACKDPEYLRKMMTRHWTWRAGLDRYMALAAGLAGVGAAGLELVGQLWRYWTRDERMDFRRIALFGGAGMVTGAASYYATAQTFTFLTSTDAGKRILQALPLRNLSSGTKAILAGGIAGGLVATALTAYFSYFLGRDTMEGANRKLAAGVAALFGGQAAGAGMMAVAMAYGTASTGTAISSLSGAAATKAATAWLGFGAQSAGGLGMAGGSAVLSGGVTVAAMVVGFGVSYGFKLVDKGRQARLIEGRINIADHVLLNVDSKSILTSFTPPSGT